MYDLLFAFQLQLLKLPILRVKSVVQFQYIEVGSKMIKPQP
jgi:hypothetical protein